MEVLSTLYIIPLMSILILVLPLSNLRGVRKVKNMIPIVIISGLLGLIGLMFLELYVNILPVSMRLLLASGILFVVGFIIRRLRKNCYVKK